MQVQGTNPRMTETASDSLCAQCLAGDLLSPHTPHTTHGSVSKPNIFQYSFCILVIELVKLPIKTNKSTTEKIIYRAHSVLETCMSTPLHLRIMLSACWGTCSCNVGLIVMFSPGRHLSDAVLQPRHTKNPGEATSSSRRGVPV